MILLRQKEFVTPKTKAILDTLSSERKKKRYLSLRNKLARKVKAHKRKIDSSLRSSEAWDLRDARSGDGFWGSGLKRDKKPVTQEIIEKDIKHAQRNSKFEVTRERKKDLEMIRDNKEEILDATKEHRPAYIWTTTS